MNHLTSFLPLIQTTSESIERYKKYPENIRYTILLDKYISLIDTLKFIFSQTYENDSNIRDKISEEMFDKISYGLDMQLKELVSLQDYLQKPISESLEKMNNISNKLDEVLLGPDYKRGRMMMDDAKDDYISKVY